MIDKMKKGLDSDAVITFLCAENAFHTKYHYGAIEGLNCLEGKNISVIGLPNISDVVYILYGMATGMRAETYPMQSMRTSYNGYDFRIKTFSSARFTCGCWNHIWNKQSAEQDFCGIPAR